MDEVSSRMFHFYVELASVHGIPAAQLTGGLPRASELLERRRRWLDWDEYLALLERFEALMGGGERAAQALREGAYRRVVRPFNAVVSYLTTARGVYWAGANWFAPSIYRHLRFDYADVGREALRLAVTIPPAYRDSDVFFQQWGASMRYAPLQIGLPESRVELERTPHRGVFHITPQARRRVGERLRGWVRAVTRSAELVDELGRHEREMRESFESLLAAHRATEEQLRSSELTQGALLAALPDLMAVVRTDGTVLEVQGGARHAFAHALLHLRGRSLSALPEVLPEASEPLVASLCSHARDAVTSGTVQQAAFTLGTGAGRLELECRTIRLREDTVLCVMRDVSERKRLETQVLLADRMALLGTLSAAVAHELNNPLAAMLANLEALRRAGAAASAGALLQDALEAGQQVRDIVGQLRTFSRPDTGPAQQVDVNALLDSMLRLTAHRLEQSVTVARDFGAVSPVLAHPGRLGQVFVNLLVNAAQSMPGGEVARNRVEVRTGMSREGQVVVEVRDNGTGIAEEHLGRIFEPFFTTKPLNEGTGLGLSICHRIVSDLGGRIEVESHGGTGSCFRVHLPAAPGAQRDLPRVKAPEPPAPARLRLLLIDDNPRLAYTLRLLLSAHDVTAVTESREGLQRMREEPWDAVLCDLLMPELDGMALYCRVQEERPELAARFIFMTGGAFTPRLREFLASVPNRCLEKPFRVEEVEAALARMAERSSVLSAG